MKRFTATVSIALIAGGLLLTGCAAPSAMDSYSGPAVMKEHHRSGKSCYATFEAPTGVSGSVRLGHKSVCTQINMNNHPLKDGSKVELSNGKIVK